MQTHNFGEIYTQYYKSSFLFVKSYVRDDMAAEDIVSDSLINLWQTIKRETVESPHSLLLTILKNNALNHLKRQDIKMSVMKSISTTMLHDLNYRIRTLEACNPSEIFSSEIRVIVEDTLLSLPEQTRLVFEMSRYENLSVKDISVKLNITSKSVEYHITKSLKALRVALKDYLFALYILLGL